MSFGSAFFHPYMDGHWFDLDKPLYKELFTEENSLMLDTILFCASTGTLLGAGIGLGVGFLPGLYLGAVAGSLIGGLVGIILAMTGGFKHKNEHSSSDDSNDFPMKTLNT